AEAEAEAAEVAHGLPLQREITPFAGASMKRTISALTLGLLVAAAACGKSDNKADSALNNDLSLAAQQRGYQPLDSLSPAERAALAPNTPAPAKVAPAPAPVRRTATTTTRRRSSSGSSSGSSSSGGSVGTTTTASSGEVVVKHTQRDAAIGAAAGA